MRFVTIFIIALLGGCLPLTSFGDAPEEFEAMVKNYDKYDKEQSQRLRQATSFRPKETKALLIKYCCGRLSEGTLNPSLAEILRRDYPLSASEQERVFAVVLQSQTGAWKFGLTDLYSSILRENALLRKWVGSQLVAESIDFAHWFEQVGPALQARAIQSDSPEELSELFTQIDSHELRTPEIDLAIAQKARRFVGKPLGDAAAKALLTSRHSTNPMAASELIPIGAELRNRTDLASHREQARFWVNSNDSTEATVNLLAQLLKDQLAVPGKPLPTEILHRLSVIQRPVRLPVSHGEVTRWLTANWPKYFELMKEVHPFVVGPQQGVQPLLALVRAGKSEALDANLIALQRRVMDKSFPESKKAEARGYAQQILAELAHPKGPDPVVSADALDAIVKMIDRFEVTDPSTEAHFTRVVSQLPKTFDYAFAATTGFSKFARKRELSPQSLTALGEIFSTPDLDLQNPSAPTLISQWLTILEKTPTYEIPVQWLLDALSARLKSSVHDQGRLHTKRSRVHQVARIINQRETWNREFQARFKKYLESDPAALTLLVQHAPEVFEKVGGIPLSDGTIDAMRDLQRMHGGVFKTDDPRIKVKEAVFKKMRDLLRQEWSNSAQDGSGPSFETKKIFHAAWIGAGGSETGAAELSGGLTLPCGEKTADLLEAGSSAARPKLRLVK